MKIKVLDENIQINIGNKQNQTLLQVLQENNLPVSHMCNGNGTCGKCKIKLVSGNLPITETDRRILAKEEVEQGIRLACKVKIEEILEMNADDELILALIDETEENIVVETMGALEVTKQDLITDKQTEKKYFVAIDIGTTTIAMALVDAQTGEVCDAYTSLNHQRNYGADVLSRISAANSGKAEELKRLIEDDLWKGICKLICSADEKNINSDIDKNGEVLINIGNISRLVICGNTTMIHLLRGFSCESLGKYPFHSEHLAEIKDTFKGIPITILPGISAFVGGDILAGILACPGFETEKISLFIDLGTNGEMVLGNKEQILTASTAAGPAFEGGNIICGMASVPGSICQVKIQNQRAVVKTIRNELPPKGICGTGLISVVAELLENHFLDEQGLLKCPYQKAGYPLWTFENGDKIAVYQQDIREFQMAKSAIRAGISILMEDYGCTAEQISHVYLAGGFGTNLSWKDVIITGILPEEFREKIEFVGNTALKGAVLAGCKSLNNNEATICFEDDNKYDTDKKVKGIIERTGNISLAENVLFHEKYLEYMNFPVL